METAKHTPGPWICHSGMVWVDGPNVYPRGDDDGVPIARMDRVNGKGTAAVERDENARFIAAAPETAAERDRLKVQRDELLAAAKRVIF